MVGARRLSSYLSAAAGLSASVSTTEQRDHHSSGQTRIPARISRISESSRPARQAGTSSRPTPYTRDNIYARPGVSDRVKTDYRPKGKTPKPVTKLPNNVYTDKNGDVYRRNNTGKWDKRENGKWTKPAPANPGTQPTRPGTRPAPGTPGTKPAPTNPNTRPAPQPKPGQPSIQPCRRRISRSQNRRSLPHGPRDRLRRRSRRHLRILQFSRCRINRSRNRHSLLRGRRDRLRRRNRRSLRIRRFSRRPTIHQLGRRNLLRDQLQNPIRRSFSLRRHPDSIVTQMHETGHGQRGRRRSRRELRRRITRGNRNRPIIHGILRRTTNHRRVRITKTSGNDKERSKSKSGRRRDARIDSIFRRTPQSHLQERLFQDATNSYDEVSWIALCSVR